MKIRAVSVNNRRKAFAVRTAKGELRYPFAKTDPRPTGDDPIARVWIDKELDSEGFTYALGSGQEGTVHIEQVLEYNKDPDCTDVRSALVNTSVNMRPRPFTPAQAAEGPWRQ